MKSYARVKYNECSKTESLTADTESYSWTDYATGSADTISLTLQNISGKWFKGYFPDKKDNIQLWIITEDWPALTKTKKNVKAVKKGTKAEKTAKKNEQSVYCGRFAVDSLNFSGTPETLELSALSVPINSGFNVSEKSRTWKKTSLKRILSTVAKWHGMSLQYSGGDHKIESMSQSAQTDLDFICSLCSEYDTAIKIYNNKIVAYNKDTYEKKAARYTITKGQEESYSIDCEASKECNSVKIQYTTGKKSKALTYQFTRPKTKGNRQMIISEKAESLADAEKKAKAALRENIRECRTVSLTMMGNVKYLAAENFNLKGFGKLDGKYFIDVVTHEKSGGKYTSTISAHLCITDF